MKLCEALEYWPGVLIEVDYFLPNRPSEVKKGLLNKPGGPVQPFRRHWGAVSIPYLALSAKMIV